MKVLGIVCSPRKNGNTEVLVQATLAKAQEEGVEIELLSLAGKTIAPCDGCNSCGKTGKCHIKDDMQDIYTKLLEADGIVFGSPVYYWSVSAQAKALIDRTHTLYKTKALKHKIACAVVTAERSGGVSALEAFANFFTLQEMLMIGWAIGFTGEEGFADKQAVRKDKLGMKRAEALGKTMVQYLQSHQMPAR